MTERAGVRIKVCGITRLEDALLAAELGAWAVGFVFHRESPRAARPERVGEITRELPAELETVGVFVNLPSREVERMARLSGVGIAQLHGNESPEELRELEASGLRTIRALRLREATQLAELERFTPSRGFLIDAAVEGRYGGTGEPADWRLARQARARVRGAPLILSGGLRPENVAAAIASVEPWAVDVASGVEECPGIKSAAKMREFFEAVRLVRPGAHGRREEER